MTQTDFISKSLINRESFMWKDRLWTSQNDAMEKHEMFNYLRTTLLKWDSETAYSLSVNGGTFDITSNSTFRTYTVVKGVSGVMRLFRASDVRELRDGQTW